MDEASRVVRFCAAAAIGALVAKAIETVTVVVSLDLTALARALTLPVGLGVAAMFAAGAATLASNRKGLRASCLAVCVAPIALAFDGEVKVSPLLWVAIVACVALGGWLGHARFRQ
ncbi:MAG: hypothetical protein FD124_3354 [Alphaproteobacteria bacterium]|nr:MAG: hypothetical protein FD160_3832 [Caulobacteraceae bacterium]TPW02564.1 MAG: hypothetical protein FD124_3354 [Alphaproteobacteria bacterium]